MVAKVADFAWGAGIVPMRELRHLLELVVFTPFFHVNRTDDMIDGGKEMILDECQVCIGDSILDGVKESTM